MFFPTDGGSRRHSARRGNRRHRQETRHLRLEQLESRRLLHGGSLAHAETDLAFESQHHAAESLAVQMGVAAAVTPQALLPDLIPWVDQGRGYLYGWIIQGNELRLTTSVANVGPGRLDIRGGAVVGNTQQVNQRIFEPDGSYTDVPAGTFTHHAGHGHIHFDGFVQFQLRAVTAGNGVGEVVAGGLKTTYCVLDFVRYSSTAPAAVYQSCGQNQGLSPGWSDYYDHGLEGQSINIAGVPSGTYWLEQVVDPDNRLMESNEGNNVARIQINLQTGGGGTTSGDSFEPNDSFSQASGLPNPEDHTFGPLSIHAARNDDYFHITATATGKLTVRTNFQNSQGDLELSVHNSAQTRLGISQTAGNSESVTIDAVGGELYYIRVWGYNGATNPSYTLTVDQPEPPVPPSPDVFENNDGFGAAASLAAVDQVYSNLSIDAPNDDDYFALVAPYNGSLSTNIAFQNAQGNLQLAVYNAAQAQLATSQTTANSEQVSVPISAGQTYYIRVFGASGATNPNYSMTVDLVDAASAMVYYLSTAEGGTLSSTDGSPNLSFADADILKLTVSGNGQRRYELHFDGSDVGLSAGSEDIDAFALRADGSILISTTGAFSVPASGGGTLSGGGEDVLRFVPSSLGSTTAGQWSLYFDGSDVGLSGAAESIDAIAVLSDGRILVSTAGAISVTGGSGQDEDLFAFVPASLGATTAGTWSLYFDGSDVALSNDNEDVDALFVRETSGNPTLHMSTLGNFAVAGASGANEDIVAFTPTTLGSTTAGSFASALAFDGSVFGLGALNVDGFHIGSVPVPAQAAALVEAVNYASAPQRSQAIATAVARPRPAARPKMAAGLSSESELLIVNVQSTKLNGANPSQTVPAGPGPGNLGQIGNDADSGSAELPAATGEPLGHRSL